MISEELRKQTSLTRAMTGTQWNELIEIHDTIIHFENLFKASKRQSYLRSDQMKTINFR